MTPRDLVLRTLSFESTPRVPRNLWLLPWAEWHHGDALEAIRRDFPDDFAYPPIDYPTIDVMQGDPYREGTSVDEWGCTFVNMHPGAIGEVKDPLVNSYDSDLDRVHVPNEWLDLDLAPAARMRESSDRFLLFGTPVRLFERLQFLRGTVNLFMDLMDQPAGLFKLRDMVHEWNLRFLEHAAKSDVDAISWMDDWGSQRSLLINPALWREFLMPCYREYNEIIRSAGKKVFVHSDGYIADVLEDAIALGIDAINAQLFCMDIEELGRRFKGRITFWGEIDRQHLLPNGTEGEVRQGVRRVADALYDGQGGVIAQCEFGMGAKPGNVRAVFDEWNAVSGGAEVGK